MQAALEYIKEKIKDFKPQIGINDNTLGVRFPDMSEIYSKKLIDLSENIAKTLKIKTQRGIYAAT